MTDSQETQTALTPTLAERRELVQGQAASLTPFTDAMRPKDLRELMRFCELVSQSAICPKSLKGDAMGVMVAVAAGEKHGMDVLGSIQNIAIINGKPSFYGDATLGICRKSPHFGGIRETAGGSFDKGDGWAECKVWRTGEEANPTVQRFTVDMAKRANLLGKQGPWREYPERMLMFRARGFALRDCFPDILSGIISAEEAMDYNTTVDHKGQPTQAVTGPVREAELEPAAQGASDKALDKVEALLNNASSWPQFKEAQAALKALGIGGDEALVQRMTGLMQGARQRILEAQLTNCKTPAEWAGAKLAYDKAPEAIREELVAQYNAAQARAEKDEEDEKWSEREMQEAQTQGEDDVPY